MTQRQPRSIDMERIKLVPGIQTPSVKWWQTENSWCSNSYLVMEEGTLYIVDSGVGSLHHADLLKAITPFQHADRVCLFNTHWHLDHSGNGIIVGELGEKFHQAHYCIPEAAREDMQQFMEGAAASIGVEMGLGSAQWLGEGDKEEFDFSGDPLEGWRVAGAYLLLTPGHSPDSLSIYLKGDKAIFVGDLLWYVNPNGLEGSIESLLHSLAKIKSLVEGEGIDYLGLGHFLPVEGKRNILDHISQYEEKEKTLVATLEAIIAGMDRVSVDYLLERLRQSDHPVIKEALRINYPYFPSYLHRFIRVFLREKGWHEVDKDAGGTWSISPG
jgi:glyoxylase-like metal-dependent hydrolase (beta-lactamase superfamily II)